MFIFALKTDIMGRAFEFRKARKFKRWAAMSKAFTKIGKEISIAVKEGGPSPENNQRLRTAIQNAKAANMPKDNIARAIKKASEKDFTGFKEIVYEGYAPHGIAVLVETATDNLNRTVANNLNRTVANVRSYFNKTNGSLGTSGSVEFLFERKCFFQIKQAEEIDLEELELELIDHGVEELFAEEGNPDAENEAAKEPSIMIYGLFPNYGNLQKALDDMSLEVITSGFERVPMELKELSEDQEAEVDKLLQKLNEDDDVQNVYHNMG